MSGTLSHRCQSSMGQQGFTKALRKPVQSEEEVRGNPCFGTGTTASNRNMNDDNNNNNNNNDNNNNNHNNNKNNNNNNKKNKSTT